MRAEALSGADLGRRIRLRERDVEVAGRLDMLVHLQPSGVAPGQQLSWVFVRVNGVVPVVPPQDLGQRQARSGWALDCFCLAPTDLVEIDRADQERTAA